MSNIKNELDLITEIITLEKPSKNKKEPTEKQKAHCQKMRDSKLSKLSELKIDKLTEPIYQKPNGIKTQMKKLDDLPKLFKKIEELESELKKQRIKVDDVITTEKYVEPKKEELKQEESDKKPIEMKDEEPLYSKWINNRNIPTNNIKPQIIQIGFTNPKKKDKRFINPLLS